MDDVSRVEIDERTGLTLEVVAGSDVSSADQEQMLRLLNRSFDGWGPSDLAVPQIEPLRWALEGPPGQPTWVTLVRDGTRIVAQNTSIDLRFLVGGEERRSRLGTHAAVDPEYQGRGIDSLRRAFQVLHLEPGFDLSLSFSVNPAIVHGNLKHGDVAPGNAALVLFKVLDARRAAGEVRARGRSRLPAPVLVAAMMAADARSRLRRRRRPPGREGWSLATVERFDERMDAFALAAAEPFDFIQLRRSDYLNWRLCDPRTGGFKVRAAERDGEVLGFSALRAQEGRGYIVDLLALPGRLDVVHSLVGDAVSLLHEAGVYGIDCWTVARHPYREVLRDHGFFDSRRSPGLTFRAAQRPGDLALLQDRAARLHVTMADGDGI